MVTLHFEKLADFDRPQEPCSAAVPFAEGKVREPFAVSVGGSGRSCPAQSRITSRWPDGSVRWLLVHFLADLPANRGRDFTLDIQPGQPPAAGGMVRHANGRLQVETGALSVSLCRAGETGIFAGITAGAARYAGAQFSGPFVTDEAGRRWAAACGEWQTVENGPVRAVLQTAGRHTRPDGAGWLDYVLRLYLWTGKPWIQTEYQLINREPGEAQRLQSVKFEFAGHGEYGRIRTALATSNYRSDIRADDSGGRLYHLIDAAGLQYEANEHIPEVFYGTFFADWNDPERGGVCATVYQAFQNFPKALETDAAGIGVHLLPEESGGLVLPRGAAKTHRLFWHFHGAGTALSELDRRSLQFQMPDRPTLAPAVYAGAGVFEQVFPEKMDKRVEWLLISRADHRCRAYGILHWGDAPDEGYTAQGRGGGQPVWTNNEYDFPHAAMLMFARTGLRRMQDYMRAAARHWMDVDICHASDDPLRQGAQIMHSAGHVTGEVAMSHEWVQGLLDYYHQTGEREALEAAGGIGENVLRLLRLPMFRQKGGLNARETGWGLRVLVALWEETGEPRWMEAADGIIRHFEIWMETYGGWLAPYTDHTVIRIPFMISVAVGSLMRYYRVKPQPRVREMIVRAVRDMVDHCRMANGLFYYKELPSLQRLGGNTMVLEALADAYELTGDADYLRAGLDTFRLTLQTVSLHAGGAKRVAGDALLTAGPGPKLFAQSFYPIAVFSLRAAQAGLIPPDPWDAG